MWCNVLEEVNHTQKYLQTKGISLDNTIQKLVTLKLFFEENRDELVENALTFSKTICEELVVPTEKFKRKSFKKVMPGGEARDETLTLKLESRRGTFNQLTSFIMTLKLELNRCKKYIQYLQRFSHRTLSKRILKNFQNLLEISRSL